MTIGQLITGRYRLDRLIGRGGMGAVYLAEDMRLRREVAIKICSTQRLSTEEAKEAADLFQGEALTLARLRHPGLTAVWDYFNQDDEWYLVMEYVPGMTLRDVLAGNGGRLAREMVMNYADQLCDVLNYLHRHSPPIVFRDLKPSNIMVMPDGTLKLIDFGIARLFSPEKSADTSQFGTPGYSPPEQYGGQTEPRSDIYSLGVVVLQMLTGYNPQGSFVAPRAHSVDSAVSAEVDDVLARATATEPVDRFPTVADFCVALRRAMQSSAASLPATRAAAAGATILALSPSQSARIWTPPPKGLPARPEGAGKGRGLVLLLLLCVLLGSLGGGGYLLRGHIAEVVAAFDSHPARPAQPSFVLQGTITYTAPGKNGDDIWIRDSGGTPHALMQAPAGTNAALPSLSPDKRRLAYTLDTGVHTQLWVIDDLDRPQPRRLLPEAVEARAPSWSSDGKLLAVEMADATMPAGDHDIVVLDPDTGKIRPIITTPSWEGGPAWSPDGRRIAFHAIYDGCMAIYVANIDGSNVERLTQLPSTASCTGPRPDGDSWPAWSPDGNRIAFGHTLGGISRLSILDFRDSSIKTYRTSGDATGQGELSASHPRWSPDGRAIMFDEGSVERHDIQLSRLDLQSNEITTLPNSKGAHFVDWRP